MSSRIERKRLRREQREREQAERRRAEKRVQRREAVRLFGISTAIGIVIVCGATVISLAGGEGVATTRPAPPPAVTDARAAVEQIEHVPQGGTRLGRVDAPVHLVEFVDLRCAACATYTRSVLPRLIDRYVRTGRLRIDLLPLALLGDGSRRTAKAAAFAATHDRLWQFAGATYASREAPGAATGSPAFLRRIAATAGVPEAGAVAASRDPGDPELLVTAKRAARRHGVHATPGFAVGRRGEPLRRVELARLDPRDVTRAVDAEIAR